MAAPFRMIGFVLIQWQRASAAAQRVFEILDESPEITERPGAAPLTDPAGRVEFDDVGFTYSTGDGTSILDGFSLTVEPGETVAVVGRTGSGKSTLGRLLPRFYDVDRGEVRIDGIDVRDLRISDLRRAVTVATDDPFLFATTVRDNVAFARPDADEASVAVALVDAAAGGFVTAMPGGTDTMLGERGSTISGGQRQRLAIARALVADPAVLVLDDATSAIDTEVEERIHSAPAPAPFPAHHHPHRPSPVHDRYGRPGGVHRRREGGGQWQPPPSAADRARLRRGPHRYRRHRRAGGSGLMFSSPVGMRSGPTSIQAAAQAGLPHADVPGDLRARVERVLDDEPAHPDPGVQWSRTTDESGSRFGLGRFLWPHRYRLAVAFLLVAVETIALQLGPVLTQIGVDDGIVARDRSVLVAAAVAYVVLLAVAAAAGAARTAFTGRLGERLMERLRVRTFEHMQRQQMDFYTTERAGVLLTRMTSDIEALSVLFNEGIVNFAVQGLTLAVITVLLFNYDPLLALITLAAAVPPTLASSMWFRRRAAADYRSVRDRIGDLLGNLQESLAGIRVIAAHDRRDVNVAEHRRVVNRHRDANLRASRANSLYGPGSEAIGIATQAVLLAVGGAMTASGRITVGELAAYLLFLTAFFAPVQALVQLYNSYQQGGAAIAKLRELFSTRPTVTDRPGAEVLAPVRGEIALDGVCFSYRDGSRVLHDVSLHVSPGETIALVGETGAGKSTVARLIARLYDPTEGAVRIDGRDLRDVTVTSLRSQIGVVSQEPFLFAGTVRDNVGFARPGATDAELHEALSAVGMSEVVERLGGLDGIVHEAGGHAVGGRASTAGPGEDVPLPAARAGARRGHQQPRPALGGPDRACARRAAERANRGDHRPSPGHGPASRPHRGGRRGTDRRDREPPRTGGGRRALCDDVRHCGRATPKGREPPRAGTGTARPHDSNGNTGAACRPRRRSAGATGGSAHDRRRPPAA